MGGPITSNGSAVILDDEPPSQTAGLGQRSVDGVCTRKMHESLRTTLGN